MKTRAYVDPEMFLVERLKAGLTRTVAAALLRVSERSVRNWEAGRASVPYCAFRLMCIEGGYHLPGEHWRGFILRGDTIWSPEGKAFSSHDLAWWQLTCELARERRHRAFELATLDPSAAANQLVAEAEIVLPRAADRRDASTTRISSDCPSLQNRTFAANQDSLHDAPPSPAQGFVVSGPTTGARREPRSAQRDKAGVAAHLLEGGSRNG